MKTSGIANVCQLKAEPVCDFMYGWVMSCFTAVTPPVSMSFQLKRGNVARILSVSIMVLTRVSASNEAAMNTEQLMLSKDCQWCGDWAMQPREVQTAHNLWHISKGWWIHFRTPRRLHNPPCIWTCIIWINPPPQFIDRGHFPGRLFQGGGSFIRPRHLTAPWCTDQGIFWGGGSNEISAKMRNVGPLKYTMA